MLYQMLLIVWKFYEKATNILLIKPSHCIEVSTNDSACSLTLKKYTDLAKVVTFDQETMSNMCVFETIFDIYYAVTLGKVINTF